MRVVIVSGSHRKVSESYRVAQFIGAGSAAAGFSGADLIDLAQVNLPLWDEGVWQGDAAWAARWSPIAATLQAADALVLIAPEWGGMVPAALKNFLLLATSRDVGHKPAMIVGVSSGMGGAYPVAELRMSGYKNTRLVFVPDHVVLRNVAQLLQGVAPVDALDAEVRERVAYSMRCLAEYAKALKLVRASGVIDSKKYPYGQ